MNLLEKIYFTVFILSVIGLVLGIFVGMLTGNVFLFCLSLAVLFTCIGILFIKFIYEIWNER